MQKEIRLLMEVTLTTYFFLLNLLNLKFITFFFFKKREQQKMNHDLCLYHLEWCTLRHTPDCEWSAESYNS